MDHDLARIQRSERERLYPVHTNVIPRLCEGYLLWEREHPGEDQHYCMLQDERYGGIPKSTLHRIVGSVRELKINSAYVDAAAAADFYLRAPPVRFLDISPMYAADRWAYRNSEEQQRRHAVLMVDEDR